jgi:hypothetical protein
LLAAYFDIFISSKEGDFVGNPILESLPRLIALAKLEKDEGFHSAVFAWGKRIQDMELFLTERGVDLYREDDGSYREHELKRLAPTDDDLWTSENVMKTDRKNPVPCHLGWTCFHMDGYWPASWLPSPSDSFADFIRGGPRPSISFPIVGVSILPTALSDALNGIYKHLQTIVGAVVSTGLSQSKWEPGCALRAPLHLKNGVIVPLHWYDEAYNAVRDYCLDGGTDSAWIWNLANRFTI